MLLTGRNTSSHRFPCVTDRMVAGGPSEDTICVLYLMDQVAGFFVYNQGPATPNPIICQFIPSPLVGVKEAMNDERGTMSVGPTILRGVLNLQSAIHNLQSEIALLDISGRKVLALKRGANDVSRLAPGVYFVHSTIDNRQSQMAKVVLTR